MEIVWWIMQSLELANLVYVWFKQGNMSPQGYATRLELLLIKNVYETLLIYIGLLW